MEVNILLRPTKMNLDLKKAWIGVEKGCLILIERGIIPLICIGDFDSILAEEKEMIKEYNCLFLNTDKNETDAEVAINYAINKGYDTINIYGATGGRLDHFIANLKLVYRYQENIILHDEKNKIFKLEKGKYEVKKDNYKYLSLFCFKDCQVTLKNTKYLLDNRHLTSNDIYTISNEIENEFCLIEVKEGKVLIVQSND